MNLTGNYDPAHGELDDNDYDNEFDDHVALRPTKWALHVIQDADAAGDKSGDIFRQARMPFQLNWLLHLVVILDTESDVCAVIALWV